MPRASKKCASSDSSGSSRLSRELVPVRRPSTVRRCRSERSSMRPSLRGSMRGAGAQADRRVQGLRAGVKEIERPDVDGAAGEIDAGRRRSRRWIARGDLYKSERVINCLVPSSLRREIGQLLIGSLPGDRRSPPSCGRWRASSGSAASSCSPATSKRRSRSPSSRTTCRRWRPSCRCGSASIRRAAAWRG